MKRILYVSTVSSTINSFLVPHIKALIQNGNLVDCAANLDYELNIDIDKDLHDIGVRFFQLSFSRSPFDTENIKAFKKLIKIQEENKYDIVHLHTPIASAYGRLLKLKFPNLRIIYTAHGFHFFKGAPLINWIVYYPIEKFMARYTDDIITMNSEDYERAKRLNFKNVYKLNGVGVDLEKYTLNNFDKNYIRKKLGLKETDFVILMIAEVNKNKNHKQMIDAIEILKNKGIKNIKVICAGDGDIFDKTCSYIKEKKLENNIKMLGFRTDVNELIVACDIGILMSYREGLPRNIMELMACGKPIIGTNIRGIRDLVENEVNGYLVRLSDISDTANAIERLYLDRKIYKIMSGNCKVKIKNFSIEKVLRDLSNINNLEREEL